MSKGDKPKIEELADEAALWDSYREARQNVGIDITQFYADLAAEQKRRLTSPGAREDFDELCENGCLQLALAAIVALLHHSPHLERFWTEIVGRPDNREKATRALENAIQTLENLFGYFIALENKGKSNEFSKIGRLPISQIVSELRIYIKVINFANSISADTETRSPVDLSKYLLTSYVRRMTGRFHDRNVSGLIAEITGPIEYNEVAQRMWRARNYKRLDKHFSWMTRFLVAMSVVIAHST
jgi:hypothetical protein